MCIEDVVGLAGWAWMISCSCVSYEASVGRIGLV